VTFQGLDVRFPLRAAEGPMTKDWLLNRPKLEEACVFHAIADSVPR
jgi:hypothetical protein